MENKIYILGDIHARSFYKPVLQVKDCPIIFLGDYMDPYYWEGFTDEEGVEKLKEIFDFARNNKNVVLLAGNHCASWLWSRMGFERTSQEFYKELHKIYRENVDLLHPIYKIGDTIFSHAAICTGWINRLNSYFEFKKNDFRITEENILSYIQNEWALELKHDKAIPSGWYSILESPIFDIGQSRGGDSAYGGPFWADLYADYWNRPFDWKNYMITGHQQQETTGSIFMHDGLVCIDSRAIFEYNPETHFIVPSQLNDEKTKAEIPDFAWKGRTIRFREDDEESE